jgi:hypothetical protein
MTPANFNWLLHVMLVYHTKFVLKKQQKKQNIVNAQNAANAQQNAELNHNNEEPDSDDEDLGI